MTRLLNTFICLIVFTFGFVGLAIAAQSPAPNPVPLPPEQAPFWITWLTGILGSFPEINAWIVAILGALMGICRALSELFVFIAGKTASKKDDKISGVLSRVSLWLTTVFGWFSVGTPKKIVDKKDSAK
jgi:hypothetical protein